MSMIPIRAQYRPRHRIDACVARGRGLLLRGRAGSAALAAILLVAASPGAAPSWGRESSDPLAEHTRFFGSVDVSIVNLDVMVTTRDGEPVDGLRKEDFRLLVDGEPVEIANFFAASEAVAEPATAGGETVPVPDRVLPSSQRLWLVVYVDSTSIRGLDRNRVLVQLKDLLAANLGQGDRVMVVAQSGEQEIRHRFGDPPEDALAVLDEILDEVGGTGQYESERVAILNRLARGSAPRVAQAPQAGLGALRRDTRVQDAEIALNEIYSWAEWRRAGLRSAATRMEALLDSLAGVKGRKAMLYVGEGTPYRVGESLFQAWADRYRPMFATMRQPPGRLLTLNPHREASRYSVQREYARLAERAAASRVAFYAIDAGRAAASTGISAELPGSSGTVVNETSRRLAQQEALQRLVETTGGRYLADLDRVDEVVAGLQRDFSRYYSLGFAPPGEADGERRNVRVEVLRPDVEVRHRSSFRAASLDQQMAEELYAALYLGVAPNPLAVELERIRTEPADEDGTYVVTLLARIPLSSILLVPQADELLGRATAWLAVANAGGGMSDVHGRRLPIHVRTEELTTAMGQDVGYTLQVLVGSGRQEVALVVRDELAVISSTVTLQLDDGEPVAGGAQPPATAS